MTRDLANSPPERSLSRPFGRRSARAGSLHLRVLAPFVAALAVLAFVSISGFEILSAVRAYVGGESLWSKSRAQAVSALVDYAVGHRQEDRHRFEIALAVPEGDRLARAALDLEEPDVDSALEGFRQGGNADDDLDGMVRLYRYFHATPLMRRSVAAWVEGDRGIAELRGIAEELDRTPPGPRTAGPDIDILARIEGVSNRLVGIEKEFSASLGEASHQVEGVLDIAIVATAALLALGGFAFGRSALARQQAAEDRLAAANRRWEMAADSAGIGVFDLDTRTGLVRLDAHARALYGGELPPNRLLERAEVGSRLHPDDRPLIALQSDPAAGRPGELRRGRYRVVHPGGTVRHLEAIGTFREDEERDRAIHFIGIVRDVTDELDKVRLQVERDAAQRMARSRIDFLSRLSHEIRTPLNAILGFSQLMVMDRSNPPTVEQGRRLGLIADGGRHLLRLVEDVLDLSSVESGAVALRLEPVDVGSVLSKAIDFLEPDPDRHRVRIETRLGSRPLLVLADPRRLLQVFTNLLSNACKYNAPGGLVAIEGRADADDVTIDFTDEGQGMTQAQLEGLFQPFHRLPGHAAIAGTGMGLVIVRQLLHHMNGQVEVESAPGGGTRFRVRLRRAVDESSPPPAPAALPPEASA